MPFPSFFYPSVPFFPSLPSLLILAFLLGKDWLLFFVPIHDFICLRLLAFIPCIIVASKALFWSLKTGEMEKEKEKREKIFSGPDLWWCRRGTGEHMS
jgi:hypothetical protein